MARRNARRGSRTESELEAIDRAADPTEVVDPGEHDTPPLSAVLQADDPDSLAVPVFLTNPVNVNQLPTSLGGMFSKRLAASPALAVQVLHKDDKRASVTITSPGIVVAIGRSQAEADDEDAFRIDTNQGPYRFHFTEELWARSTGAEVRLSVAVEQWAR